ncbi:MAG: transporter [Bacteroidetes bacterium]|nr:transporter [Bacteroidota bacterium]
MTVKKIIFGFAMLLALLPSKMFAQVLETEESKPLLQGQFEVGTGLEFQVSKEGTENALPLAIEYGISKKFTLLVEPVGFTSIMPKQGPHAKGIGDLEITLFYQICSEKKVLPSISISGEVKIPTAKNTQIGTGKTDYTPFLIMSKTTGKFFTSVNLSYTFLGKPSGVDVSNLFNYAIGTIFTASPKSILFAEVYGNTSAVGGAETPEGTVVTNPNINSQEISGGETVGAFGYGYYLKKELLISLGISYDNNNAILFRPGIEWKFGGKQ